MIDILVNGEQKEIPSKLEEFSTIQFIRYFDRMQYGIPTGIDMLTFLLNVDIDTLLSYDIDLYWNGITAEAIHERISEHTPSQIRQFIKERHVKDIYINGRVLTIPDRIVLSNEQASLIDENFRRCRTMFDIFCSPAFNAAVYLQTYFDDGCKIEKVVEIISHLNTHSWCEVFQIGERVSMAYLEKSGKRASNPLYNSIFNLN